MAVCHHHAATFKSPNVFTSLPSSTDDGLPALEGADPVTADERKGSTVQSLGAGGSVAGGPGWHALRLDQAVVTAIPRLGSAAGEAAVAATRVSEDARAHGRLAVLGEGGTSSINRIFHEESPLV